MPLIRPNRPRILAIYLQNGAIFTGQTYEECIATAKTSLTFNRELILNSLVRGWINERNEFEKEDNEYK